MEDFDETYIENVSAPLHFFFGAIVTMFVVCLSAFCAYSLAAWQNEAQAGQGPLAELSLPDKVNHKEIGTWRLNNFSKAQSKLFYRLLASGNKNARPLLRGASGRVVVVLVTNPHEDHCGDIQASCVFSQSSPDESLWQSHVLYLRSEHLTATKAGRFIVWHEIGHVIDNTSITYNDMLNLEKSFKTRFQTWPVSDDDKTVPMTEVWAEQWAMWATNDASQSSYQVPRAMSNKEMMTFLSHAHAGLTPFESG